MGAYVQYEFDKGFILDEERLRKIMDYLSKKDSDGKGIQYQIKVYRKDAFTYSTKDLSDLINTENDSSYNLERIEFVSQADSTYEFMLKFDANKDTVLSISGNNRDFVYVLYSDLKNYIDKEICLCNFLNFNSKFIRIASPLLLLIGLFFIALFENNDIPSVADAIISDDINEKLNMLLMLQNRRTGMIYAPLIIPIFLIVLLILPWYKIWTYFYPANVFLFGKAIAEFDDKKKLRSNLFWVIIVGSMISVIGGFIVWKLTS